MKTRTFLLTLITILGVLLTFGLQGCLFGGNDEDDFDTDEVGDAPGEMDVDDEDMPPGMEMGMPPDDAMMDDDPGMPVAEDADASGLVDEGMQAKRAGNYTLALQKFESAVAADPSNVDAHWGLAWVCAETGRTAQAISAFETVIELGASPDKLQEAEAALQRLQ